MDIYVVRKLVKNGRSPHGERGLKSVQVDARNAQVLSLPPRGAWIEILSRLSVRRDVIGRSPHGERGLKLCLTLYQKLMVMSLPPRGAWIEIAAAVFGTAGGASLPPRGAWIEIGGQVSNW